MNNADKFKLNNKFKFNAQSKRSIVPIILPSNFKINRLKSKNKILSNSLKSNNVILDINVLLGRKINNLSRNKFKFINKNRISNHPSKLPLPSQINQKILNIKGISFRLNKNGKKLCRLRATSTMFTLNKQNTKNSSSIFQYISSMPTSKSFLFNKYKIINNNDKSINSKSHLYRIVLAR